MLHRHAPDTWVTWGAYCDRTYEATQPRNPMWLEYAVSCYLQVSGGGHWISTLVVLLSLSDSTPCETAPQYQMHLAHFLFHTSLSSCS